MKNIDWFLPDLTFFTDDHERAVPTKITTKALSRDRVCIYTPPPFVEGVACNLFLGLPPVHLIRAARCGTDLQLWFGCSHNPTANQFNGCTQLIANYVVILSTNT